MTESVSLESMERSELMEQAQLLGLSVESKISTPNLLKKIKMALGEPVEEPDVAHESVKSLKQDERVTIIVAESETDKQPVVVGVNGRNYVMKRGEPVSVPLSVIEVLNNATKKVWDAKFETYKTVPFYPYRLAM